MAARIATDPRGVACLGELMLESSVRLEALPGANQTVVADGVARRLGGPAINIALHLASLGERVRLGAVLGRWDEPMLRALSDRVRLDASDIAWAEGSSDLLFYFQSADSYSAVYQRAELPAGIEAGWRRASADGAALVLAGSRHAALRRLYAEVARGAPARWKVFAPNYAIYLYTPQELADLLPAVNLICLNEAEAAHLCQSLDLQRAEQLGRHTAAAVIVTRGSDGALLHLGADVQALPSLSGRPDEVVGAGDAFLAGCLHGLMAGRDLAEAARFGSRAAAAFVCAQTPWPLLGELPDLQH